MLAPIGGAFGGLSAASVAHHSESMLEFKKGIDQLIVDLTESPAGPKNMSADPVSRNQFGGGGAAWAEASGIFTSYDNVLTQLTNLSALLGECLEAMGIAVVMSKNGMEQTDDDIRYRMLEISRRTENAKAEAARAEAAKAANGSGKPGAGLKDKGFA
ncbi:hypothetical protein ABZX98_24460 [Streptomyces sp. NPDC002992]|uniref:hypothetical protein n=1 Tax=Streptomyces sp. NPDC002992 TaxID=3154273 RepID=UPI0033B31E9D